MVVDADDVLNSRRRIAVDFHRAGPQRRFFFQDWLVAMIYRFDSDHRLRFACAESAAGIISWPFSERSLGAGVYFRWRHLAFNDDFRPGGNRQTGERAPNDLQRAAQ